MATLGERMAKTMPGQVTWANLDTTEGCSACKHLVRHGKPRNVEKDQCTLVRIHSGKPGVPLAGHRAIACTMFEAR